MRYFMYCRKSSESEDRQVLSIESQLSSLKRAFGGYEAIEIAGIYEEAFSAKAPGRPHFQDMMARIANGEAAGIVAWAPDRLARNSIDGGQIIYLLDKGIIKDLKFATYTFENNSQGKFMLQIMFGQSKYYSDALSENVKRGNRTKLENGWRPNQAPLGYLNDPITKTIVKDPVNFLPIRNMFDLMLTGAYSVRTIAQIASEQWGFRTPAKKRTGGGPLAMSTVYKMLSNPFYAGIIVWDQQTYAGKHDPMITIDEFQRVRSLLRQARAPKPQKHQFAYTGMIRCASCGSAVTAEHKVNRYGYRYVYYHCARRSLVAKCSEPSIELKALENQIREFLGRLTIDAELEAWILEQLKLAKAGSQKQSEAQQRGISRTLAGVSDQLNELTGLRLRKLISDHEFIERRKSLQFEQLRLNESMTKADQAQDLIEPFDTFVLTSNRAADWFSLATDQEKRLILKTVVSNLALKAKKLNIEAAKPFCLTSKNPSLPRLLGGWYEVGTFLAKKLLLEDIPPVVRL